MKKSAFSKPIAPAPAADAALPMSKNMLSDRPDWDELLRSLSPDSSASPDPVSNAGLPQLQPSPPAAADCRQRDRPQQSRAAAAAHSRGQLAILLPEEAHLFVGDAPFAEQTAAGKAWLAVVPLGQPSDREHATALDCAMADAISSGTEAATRALEFRSEAAQHCSADAQQRLMGRMRKLVEGDLCPAVPPVPAAENQSGSTMDDVHSGTTSSTAFRDASASLAVAVFMAELVAQVEGHCAERGWALARLWNAHIAISAQTARAQREELQELQDAHVQQEAQLLSARAEAAAVQRLRKQLANQSQAADGLRAELRAATHECNALRQQLAQLQSDAGNCELPAAAALKPLVTPRDAANVQPS